MPKTLLFDAVFVDIERQVRKMGAEDYFRNQPECPFGEQSLAAIHWREGYQEAERFPLFYLEAMYGRK